MTTSRWRLAAGAAVLAILAFLGGNMAPVYFRNLELQQFVEGITHRATAVTASDDALRSLVLEKATDLHLPVKADNVQIDRSGGALRLAVRYEVRVDLPLYTVNLHFYPGSR